MPTSVPPPAGSSLLVLPFHIGRQVTADVAGVARFRMPCAAKLLGVSVYARARGGVDNTLAVDAKVGAASLLSAPVAAQAGAVVPGAVAGTGRVADEAEISLDLDVGGTNPAWDDVTVVLTLARV